MKLWQFSIHDSKVRYGDRKRDQLTSDGCNEPYKGRFWCPKLQWFRKEACPFVNRAECETFQLMCGSL